MKAALRDIIDNDYTEEDEPGAEVQFVNDDAFEPNQDHGLVRDPAKVNTKGAPKQNVKGRGKNGPDVTKNGRPKAFDEKSKRQCGLCGLTGHYKSTCPQNPKYDFFMLL